MKEARLWKRVLNEGLILSPGVCPQSEADDLQRKCITAPIIVDSRVDEVPSTDWSAFKYVPIPFDVFWLETLSFGILNGSLFEVIRDDGIAHVVMTCILASPMLKPQVAGMCDFRIGPDGMLSDRPAVTGNPIFSFDADLYERTKITCAAMAYGAGDSLLLMSCKNVTLKHNDAEPHQARRAARRFGGDPNTYKFHTLVVRPPGVGSDSSPGIDIGMMPRHMCRGHYSEYGAQFGKGLLFGKLSGRFFVPPHLKGLAKNGVVEKSYLIPAGSK